MTLPEFKRTTIYNEFFRHLGTDRQIVAGLHVSKTLMITCSLCRLRKDYTQRDCRMMNLLNPHLTTAFSQAQFIHRLKFKNEEMQLAISSAQLAVVSVNRNFQMLMESPAAAKLISKYFQDASSKLPEELSAYVKYHSRIFVGDEFYLPPKPYEKLTADGKLIIRIIFASVSETTMLMLEEFPNAVISNSSALGLTMRESEVLLRIGHGKTDGEIARILGISVRTVQKHVENIFNKLGVETRTAATSRIRQ